MRKYIVKRLLLCILILLCVSLMIYSIMRSIPTSYVESIARQRASLPGSKSYTEWLAQLNAVYRLDRGMIEGYIGWLGDAVRGNFGDSWLYNIPVTEKFSEVIWYSFALGAVAFVLELVIAIPLGIVAARKQYSRTDYTVTVVALVGISLPTFFFATILKLVFAVKLGWLDLYGMVGRYYDQLTPFAQVLDMAKHY
ncbi:MAG: ABC transporter permease, partial [Clostridia bacterium]|nr:ABC transporter permease [Clostridia bacterium]